MEIRYYNKWFNKFRGLMFKKNFNYGIRLRCNGIHTFFMMKNIDVFLTDKDLTILYKFLNVRPNRIIMPKKNVFYTYEFPVGQISYNVGEKIEIK